jgi:hypothetical protein
VGAGVGRRAGAVAGAVTTGGRLGVVVVIRVVVLIVVVVVRGDGAGLDERGVRALVASGPHQGHGDQEDDCRQERQPLARQRLLVLGGLAVAGECEEYVLSRFHCTP